MSVFTDLATDLQKLLQVQETMVKLSKGEK